MSLSVLKLFDIDKILFMKHLEFSNFPITKNFVSTFFCDRHFCRDEKYKPDIRYITFSPTLATFSIWFYPYFTYLFSQYPVTLLYVNNMFYLSILLLQYFLIESYIPGFIITLLVIFTACSSAHFGEVFSWIFFVCSFIAEIFHF